MSPVRRQVLEGRGTLQRNSILLVSSFLIHFTATYYDPNGGFGACGNTLQNTDFIVALGPAFYNAGAHCGQTLTGKSIVVTVQDLCPGCQGTNGIDLSESAMAALDSNYIFDGVITVNWSFN
ncbi:RlpA-like double-psi beta-barrel-protein domain-containing protein-containing protein [Mycena vitilis]|nr:RlpA-like double-psi beta-barrel-protein domain-containing protein-containing protein [Mycena vitilis]